MRLLVTGITGFFGRTLVRTVAGSPSFEVAGITRREHEVSKYKDEHPGVRIYLGDVREPASLAAVVQDWRPEAVIHAAALKVVPISEVFPWEYFHTNVIGTHNLLDALPDDVPVVLISSDKAVSPYNAYGISKAAAEKLILRRRQTVIRLGNVFGSTGSVVHVWRRQVLEGRPVTITEPSMTRFFLRGEDAVKMALDYVGHSGLWVPRLKSYDLGTFLEVFEEVAPRYYGAGRIPVREGEKIHEVLISVDEAPTATAHGDVFLVGPYGTGIGMPYFGSSNADRISRSVLRRAMEEFWDGGSS